MDPIHLSRVAEKLLDALDPDGDFEPTDPGDRADLTLGSRDARTGLTSIKGAWTTSPAPRSSPPATRTPSPAPRSTASKTTEAPAPASPRPWAPCSTSTWPPAPDRLGPATLDATAVTIGAAPARRLLCDCDVIPAVLGSS
jgi:hypothetical protein